MTKDLTVGSPWIVLWKFCLPLFGNAYEATLLFIAVSFGCNIGCIS